ALDGLAACHRAGLIHGRLAPENLYVSASDPARLMILDLVGRRGPDAILAALLARCTRAGPQRPGASAYARYTPPEVVRGDAASSASDVFGMALVVVEMLTGRPLVDEPAPMASLAKLVSGRLELPHGPFAPPLRRVLERALAPIGDRFP